MRIAGDFAAPQILQKMFTVINKYCKMFKVNIDNKIKFTTQNTRANAGKSLAAGAPPQTPLFTPNFGFTPPTIFERGAAPLKCLTFPSTQNVPPPLYLRHRCSVVCSLI